MDATELENEVDIGGGGEDTAKGKETKAAGAEVKTPETDYTRLDPSKIPHHIVQQTQAFGGMFSELQQTRTKVAELTEANDALVNELQEKDKVEAQDPNEPATVAYVDKKLDKLVAAIEGKHKKEKAAESQTEQARRLNQSCLNLQKEITAEKAGEGLDAETVVREGVNWLAQNKPHLLEAAKQSDDPAREVYELSLNLVPSIRKRFDTRKNNQLLDTIQKGRISKGGGFIPPGQQKSELFDILNMPEEQLLAEIEKEELAEEQE